MAKKTAKKAAPKKAPGAGKRDATLTNLRALEKRIDEKLDKLRNRLSNLEENTGYMPDDEDL